MIDERAERGEQAQGESVAFTSETRAFSQQGKGKLIVNAQALPQGFTAHNLTYDVLSSEGEKLCTVQPGGEAIVPIEKETEIYAMPAYGFKSEKSKTNRLKILTDKTTRIRLTFIKVLSGYGVKTVLEEDVTKSDN